MLLNTNSLIACCLFDQIKSKVTIMKHLSFFKSEIQAE